MIMSPFGVLTRPHNIPRILEWHFSFLALLLVGPWLSRSADSSSITSFDQKLIKELLPLSTTPDDFAEMFFRRRINPPYGFELPNHFCGLSDTEFHAGGITNLYDAWVTLHAGKYVLDEAVRELTTLKGSDPQVFTQQQWSTASLRAAFLHRAKQILPEGLKTYNFVVPDLVEAALLPRVARCDALISVEQLNHSPSATSSGKIPVPSKYDEPNADVGEKSSQQTLLDAWIDCMVSLDGTGAGELRPWFSRPGRKYNHTRTARWPYSDVMTSWIWVHILAEVESALALGLSKELTKVLWAGNPTGSKSTAGKEDQHGMVTRNYAERRLIQRVWQALVSVKHLWQWAHVVQPTTESGKLVSQARGFHGSADGLAWPDEEDGGRGSDGSVSGDDGGSGGLLCALAVVGGIFVVVVVVIVVFCAMHTNRKTDDLQRIGGGGEGDESSSEVNMRTKYDFGAGSM